MNGFDLSKLADETKQDDVGVTVQVLTRDGDPAVDSKGKPVTMTVLGEYADPVRKVQDAQTRRILKRRARSGQVDPAEIRRDRIELAAAAVTGWAGVENNGEAVAFSRDLLVQVLDKAPWVLEQVERVMTGYSGFFKEQSKS